jgi:L-threonylcarbamoyladenylate synthase
VNGDPIAGAAEAALRGRLVVFPTDTVYGIGTRPDDAAATGALFVAKGRSDDAALPVLAASVEQVRAVAMLNDRAEACADYWPGALTLVLPRAETSRSWALGGDADTVGIRVPAHPLALALLAMTGPLAVSSANRSGEAPARTCDEITEAFGDLVEVYLCQDEPLEGSASSVVDLAHGEPRLLRYGPIGSEVMTRLLA